TGTKQTLQVIDNLLKLVNEVEPKATLRYNKYYIGLEVDGAPRNFVKFTPQRVQVIMAIKLPQSLEVDGQLKDASIDQLKYDTQFREYKVKIAGTVDDKQRGVLLSLIRQAWEG